MRREEDRPMNKFRIITLIVSIISILIFLPSCGGNENMNSTTVTGPSIIITDSIGRQVEVPEQVERIAALYSFAGYAVCLLGSGNDLVAVPGGLQRDILLVDMFPEVGKASTPREGGTINIEELLRIKPDLVIIRRDTVIDEKEQEKLDNTGIPYIVVDFSTMQQQQDAIMVIGKAIGREKEAQVYNDYYNNVIARVNEIVKDIPEEERVRLLHSENQATRATHETSLAADWTRAAGVINVSVGEDLEMYGNDYYASIEQILLWDPEVIIVNESAAYKLILGHPQWSGISAVRNNKVYQLPNGISRWGHPGSVETPLALLWTAKTVYPEKFSHIDMNEEVSYYYKTFFNMDLDDEMIETILRGGDLREPK
jgi:iron complex transport system substrate-binding protein